METVSVDKTVREGPPSEEAQAFAARFQLSDFFYVSGLVSAFFQGYLRDHYGGIISYGLTDGLLALAFCLAIITWGPRRFFAWTRLTTSLLLLLLLSVPYIFNPEAHIIEGILGFRAWNFYNLVFFYAYLRVQSDRSVYRIIALLLAVGVIVAAYGIYQFWIGPEQFVEGSRAIEQRHQFEAYSIFPEEDVQIYVFRPFSTLNSAGNLGSAMVALTFLGVGFTLRGGRRRFWRVFFGLAILALFSVMFLLTGSRTSVIAYVFGVLCMVGLQRRVSFAFLLVLLCGLAVYGAVVISQGAILGRLETLNPMTTTGVRGARTNWQGVYMKRLEDNMGWVDGMMRNPLGLGLGTTGVGIPNLPGAERWGFRGIGTDSDLGRAAVEMGIPGFLLVLYLVASMVVYAVRAGNRLRDGPWAPLASSLAALVVGFLPIMFLGNPLYGPPASLLIWSSLGVLLKLEALATENAASAQRAAEAIPAVDRSPA